jgi:hypothetical protein
LKTYIHTYFKLEPYDEINEKRYSDTSNNTSFQDPSATTPLLQNRNTFTNRSLKLEEEMADVDSSFGGAPSLSTLPIYASTTQPLRKKLSTKHFLLLMVLIIILIMTFGIIAGFWIHRSHTEDLAKYQKLTMPFSPEEQTSTYDLNDLYSEESSELSSVSIYDPSTDDKPAHSTDTDPKQAAPKANSVSKTPRHYKLSDFTIKEYVGKGGFAKAYLATRPVGDKIQNVCIKSIKNGKRKQYRVEKSFLSLLRQKPYIVQILTGFRISRQKWKEYNEAHKDNKLEGRYFIVMEYAEKGTLYNIKPKIRDIKGNPDAAMEDTKNLKKWLKNNSENIRNWLGQIIIGLQEIHSMNIVHQDIKAGNILLHADKNIRIADMGLAAICDPTVDSSWVGTKPYFPPERVFKKPVGFPADIFAVGMIIYFFFGEGNFPSYRDFKDPSQKKALEKLMQRNSTSAHTWSLRIEAGSDLEDLYKRMTEPDPAKRITIPQIKEHPYFKTFDWNKQSEFVPHQKYAKK